MLGAIDKMIHQFGTPMTLVCNDAEMPIRAFLQETRSKSLSGSEREFMPLGEIPKGMYVYIGPVEPVAAVGDVLKYQGKILELRRAEPIFVGDTAVYRWGLCVEKGGEDTWGS